MMIITRKVGEAVMIGGTRVVVYQIQPGQIALAIDPEPGVKVTRGEKVARSEVDD
jgi:sRNA-binding carbon storage regulator CsrA